MPLTPDQRAEAQRMREDGHRIVDIAQRFGISYGSAQAALGKNRGSRVGFPLGVRHTAALRREAELRHMTPSELACLLIEHICDDSLFTAVLDTKT